MEFEHEKFRPREEGALWILRNVISLVAPIMRRRGWKIGTLYEFWPRDKYILGLNEHRGEKIYLRLRCHFDESKFLPMEAIVDIMLHELSHIDHEHHNTQFNSLWNELYNEYEDLMLNASERENSRSTRQRLEGDPNPEHEVGRRATGRNRTLTAESSQKLGDVPSNRYKDIQKVVSDAATRFLNAVKGCLIGTKLAWEFLEEKKKNRTRFKADEDNQNNKNSRRGHNAGML